MNNDHTRFSALLTWQILHEIGHFPPFTPPSLRAFIYGGQKTVEQLVDRYQIRHPGVRDLLIEYLRRRRADCDYVTIEGLSRHLAGYFWATIEQINPAQDTLALDQATYAQWREALNYRKDGKPRRDPHGILLNVRGFYVDLHSWAIDDPATWGPWVATCPIPRSDLRGMGTRRRRLNERIADRTRARQPLLPTLMAHVESRYGQAKALMDAGAAGAPNQVLDHAGRRYRRMSTDNDRKRDDDPRPQVRLCDLETGEIVNATMAEDQAFWVWAAVEVLRLTGIRAEELVELTHLSIRQYQRPNGEVIALLVVAPSKTDRERVVPMSAELFHVIAAIIRRHTTGGRRMHLLHRYDDHERTWSDPLPFLFQRQLGSVRNVVAKGTVLNWIKAACDELAESNKAFEDLRFTPHDFRRLFATDLVNSGLPIHIGARLLGHLSIETTRSYVAVFDEDVIHHYQQFLEHRRQQRPQDEYRPVTDQEWVEFQEHFDKRKVELGGCGRPYGTPCAHEHACIRCPQLNVNPTMLPRLELIETDLLERRGRAEKEGWLGEIEGIDLTLQFLRQKREQTQRLARIAPVPLGLPTVQPRR